jgi:glycosyltransferase involved in cell wall biosynthesis
MNNKNNLLIDGRAFSLQKVGGVSQIWAKFLGYKEIYNHFNVVIFLYPYFEENIHWQQVKDSIPINIKLILSDIPSSDNYNFDTKKSALHRANKIKSLLGSQPNIVMNTYYGENIYPSCKKYASVFHDFAHEELDVFKAKNTTNDVIRRKIQTLNNAGLLIFVSYSSYKKGIRFYPNIVNAKAVVIYHGHDDIPVESKKMRYQVIHVGARESYKNFKLISDNFHLLVKEFPELFLMVAGGSEPNQEEINLLIRYPHNIRFVQNITDNEMNRLIAGSEVFVSCSKYEGFGIPVLNSLRLGTTVVLNKIDVYREIADDKAFYFNGDDIYSLIDSLKLAFRNSELINSYHRPWSVVFDEYINILSQFCNE